MKYSIFFFLLVFLSSCEGVKVTNDWDKKVDFNQFKTYSLYPWDRQNDQVINDYDKQTIITAIKGEMEKRGYTFMEDKGELVVSAFVIVEDKTSYQAYSNHYAGWAGYGGGWGYAGGVGFYGYGPVNTSTVIYGTDYEQGTLIIDIFNFKDKRLVWQGIGTGEITNDLDKRDRRLPETITSIFRRYPVTPKSQKKLDEMKAE